jgi:hypothetical protein
VSGALPIGGTQIPLRSGAYAADVATIGAASGR